MTCTIWTKLPVRNVNHPSYNKVWIHSISYEFGQRRESFRFFFKSAVCTCINILMYSVLTSSTLSGIDYKKFWKSTGKMVFRAYFKFHPHIVLLGQKSKKARKIIFPINFGIFFCNRFLRAWRMLIQKVPDSTKIRKLFLRSLM